MYLVLGAAHVAHRGVEYPMPWKENDTWSNVVTNKLNALEG